MEEGFEQGQKTSAGIYLLNMLIDVAIGVSLQTIWAMINILQFMVLYPEMQGIVFSGHLTMFLDKLRIIADGDFIPYEWRTWIIRAIFSEEYVEFNG